MSAVFPFPPQPITARRQIRKAVIAALKRAALSVGAAAVSVDSPGDWPYPQAKLPVISVRSATDSKTGTSKGQDNFTTAVEVDVRAACAATTAEAAQDAIDLLWFGVEQAILLDFYLLSILQNVPSVESAFEIKAEGQIHFAGAIGRFRFETFETFDIGQSTDVAADQEWTADSGAPPEDPPSIAEPIAPLTEVTIDVTRPGSTPPYSEQPGDVGLTITFSED